MCHTVRRWLASGCEGAKRAGHLRRTVPLGDGSACRTRGSCAASIDDRLGQDSERPIGFDNGEMPTVDRGDLVDPESFRTGDHRRVHGAQGQAAVLVDQVSDPQPVGRVDGLDIERPGGQVREEAQLGLCTKPGTEQVDHLGDHEGGDDQRSRVSFQQIRAGLVMLVVGVDIRVQRTGVDYEGYDATSLARISSMRSEMSCRPLRPAPRAPSTRRPLVVSPRSRSSARAAGTIAANRWPLSVR